MSKSPLAAVFSLSMLLLPACAISEPASFIGESSYQLKEASLAGGGVVSYRLRIRSPYAAELVVRTEIEEPHTELGIEVVELDPEQARKLGDHAHSGLLIQAVDEASPAADAGLRPGEVLLRVNGKRVVYHETLGEAVDDLPAGELAELELRPVGQPDAEPRTVQLVPAVKMRRSAKIEQVRLQRPEESNPVAYMGVALRVFPPDYTEAVFGHTRPVSVITGVTLGSPAYLAGLRSGDVILRVDGVDAPDPEGLLDLVRERGARGEGIALSVRSKYGEFTAEVELDDYSGVARTYLPLIWSTRVSALRTRWWVLLGGWLVGYDNRYTPTSHRRPAERGHFTALMGLIRHDWTASGSSTRLLWFIHFD